MMKVSIVTISYNQAMFLEQTINSVLTQDYPNIEYIVVDPGSTDGSREIIEKYKNRITKIIFEPDQGPADGLNKGFAASTGQIFGFLNSDDVLFPGAITKVMREFKKKSKSDVISGHGFLLDENNRRLKAIFSHRFGLPDSLYGACVLVQQATFYRREIIVRVGGFNISNKINWDGELWDDIAASSGKFYRIHAMLAGFRSHPSSITNSVQYRQTLISEQERIAKKLGIKKIAHLSSLFWAKNRLLDPLVTGASLLQKLAGN